MREFYKEASVIREFMNQRGAWFAPKIYMTYKLVLSLRGNLKISPKSQTQEERFEIFPLKYLRREFLPLPPISHPLLLSFDKNHKNYRKKFQ